MRKRNERKKDARILNCEKHEEVFFRLNKKVNKMEDSPKKKQKIENEKKRKKGKTKKQKK